MTAESLAQPMSREEEEKARTLLCSFKLNSQVKSGRVD
jgi:hypothetical protein